MSDSLPLAFGTLILGIGIGFLVSGFVVDNNVEYYEVKHRKEMVDLGVGYYDARTGGFRTKVCNKIQP